MAVHKSICKRDLLTTVLSGLTMAKAVHLQVRTKPIPVAERFTKLPTARRWLIQSIIGRAPEEDATGFTFVAVGGELDRFAELPTNDSGENYLCGECGFYIDENNNDFRVSGLGYSLASLVNESYKAIYVRYGNKVEPDGLPLRVNGICAASVAATAASVVSMMGGGKVMGKLTGHRADWAGSDKADSLDTSLMLTLTGLNTSTHGLRIAIEARRKLLDTED